MIRIRHKLQGFKSLLLQCAVVCAFITIFGLSATAQTPNEAESADPTPAADQTAVHSSPTDEAPLAEEQSAVEPERTEAVAAVVIEVTGTVDWALPGVSPLIADGWTPVVVDDRLQPGTVIRTGLRSHVNLQFGETTTVSVRSATFASIDQFYRSATTETVRIGLGYGTVRGGSSEGEIRADVTVDSTVATLAKRGTEGWQIQVEPGTGRFRISLAEYGLVEAIQKLDGRRTVSRRLDRSRRSVRPGEYATPANIANMWIKQDIFDRNVTFYDASAITEADADFALRSTRGFGELDPGGGATLVDLSGRAGAGIAAARTEASQTQPPSIIGLTRPVSRPEGNFGTPDVFRKTPPAGSRPTPKDRR